jgi:hypothetical protein
VLESIGRRWETTGEGVEVEHLFAESTMSSLASLSARLSEPRNAAEVLLSCVTEEQHSLPLYAVSAALAERGISARMLGARMPTDALTAAVRRTGPAAVLLYASMPVPPDVVEQVLRRAHPTTRILLGGPGWGTPSLPPYAELVGTLGLAVHRICEILAA